MAETLEDRGYGPNWYPDNIHLDLINQGGLNEDEIIINPSNNSPFYGGSYNGYLLNVLWIKDEIMSVTSIRYHKNLITAFEKVVEYAPFARYITPLIYIPMQFAGEVSFTSRDVVTVEWNKIDAPQTLQRLKNERTEGLVDLLK
jgi:hypothetical protein